MEKEDFKHKLSNIHDKYSVKHETRTLHYKIEGKQDGELELPRDDSALTTPAEMEIKNEYCHQPDYSSGK